MDSTHLTLIEVMALVIALTQWLKDKAKIEGAKAEWLSAIIGLVLGALYQVTLYSSLAAVDWFAVVIAALGMALVPSGLYKTAARFL